MSAMAYARGRRKEYDVLRRLRAAGWHAQRTAGSHGLFDVVAIKGGQPVKLVQVKYTKRPGLAWADANWHSLAAFGRDSSIPADVEAWVYRFGVAAPQVWVPTPDGLTLLPKGSV